MGTGGRLEIGPTGGGSDPADESPALALEREFREETGWIVTTGPQLEGGTWIYEPLPGRRVLIVTYGCPVLTPDDPPVLSHEHKKVGLFRRDEIGALPMPVGYKASISTWFTHLQR